MSDNAKKQIVYGILCAAVLLTGCGKSGGGEQPNFIVQNVQTTAGGNKTAVEKDQATDGESAAKEKDKASETGEADAENELPLLSESISTVQEDVAESQNGNGEVGQMTAEDYRQLTAMTTVYPQHLTMEELDACFYYEEISDIVFERMRGKSYGQDCTIPLSELRYVRVLHYGFDGEVHIGEMVVNQAIAQDIVEIFRELYDAGYLIEKMVLIDTYDGDDNVSMAENNTSSFNFRLVEGKDHLSKHAYGLAVDINPLYNPYLPIRDGVEVVLPENAGAYVDRTTGCEYYIQHGDLCYEAFVSRGFTWGGDWNSSKDYQHFSKVVE